jgi:hypothetical protein
VPPTAETFALLLPLSFVATSWSLIQRSTATPMVAFHLFFKVPNLLVKKRVGTSKKKRQNTTIRVAADPWEDQEAATRTGELIERERERKRIRKLIGKRHNRMARIRSYEQISDTRA